MKQPDLFIPPPDIRGETTIGGRDLWYCRRTCRWTTDPRWLFWTDEEIKAEQAREDARIAKELEDLPL